MSDQIERALRQMAPTIRYPETPRFVIPAAVVPARRRVWPAVALAVAALALVFAFPAWRQAVADFLGIGAVELSVVNELPESAILREPSGHKVSLVAAGERVDFDILTLAAPPDCVYLDESIPGGMVTLSYRHSKLLITQLEAETDFGEVRKLLLPETIVTRVTIDGQPGFWIEEEGHALIVVDRNGAAIEDTARLAASTLLYEDGGRTIRIEGDMTLDQALDIASLLR